MPLPLLKPFSMMDQSFGHRDRSGVVRVFHVPSVIEVVRRSSALCRPTLLVVDLQFLMNSLNDDAVIPEILIAIPAKHLNDPVLVTSILGEPVILDGRHRACRAAQLGKRGVRAYNIPLPLLTHAYLTEAEFGEETFRHTGVKPDQFKDDPAGGEAYARECEETMRRKLAAEGKPFYAQNRKRPMMTIPVTKPDGGKGTIILPGDEFADITAESPAPKSGRT